MDWTLVIARNCEALQRVVAALFALAGLTSSLRADVVRRTSEGQPTTLPRHVYRAILLVLRPAESALRRLIIIVACGMKLGDRLLNTPAAQKANAKLWQEFSKLPPKFAHFCLIDPLKRFNFSSFKPICGPLPRISVPGFLDPVFFAPVDCAPDDLINAGHLSRRLDAISRALADLPRQARRLARWQARRDFALKQKEGPVKPRRLSPCRPGSPPGARLRRRHEIDHIVRECHELMLDQITDTS